MANDNGFAQLALGGFNGGVWPDSPDPTGPNDEGFTQPPATNFPNTHCIWGINMFDQLPDVVERSYEHNAGTISPSLVPQTISVAIAAGASLSGPVNLGDGVLSAIAMPAAWTAAALTFQVSDDGGVTWAELRDSSGNAITVAAPAAGNRLELDATAFKSCTFLKVRSGTSIAPVNQVAARSLILVSRKFYPAE